MPDSELKAGERTCRTKDASAISVARKEKFQGGILKANHILKNGKVTTAARRVDLR